MRSYARVRFDRGMIFLHQSQFFAMHSYQWNCFILYRSWITSNGFFSSLPKWAKAGVLVMLTYFEINKRLCLDSMLSCVCSVIDHRKRQNVVRTCWHTRLLPRVPLFCSYLILTSSVIYYWTDARQHGIYLLICEKNKQLLSNPVYFIRLILDEQALFN